MGKTKWMIQTLETGLLATSLCLPWAACSRSSDKAPGTATAATAVVKQRPLVRVAQATRRTMLGRIEISGNIRQSQKAAISPAVPGTIRRVLKQEGDLVKKGEKIAELDTRDFRLAIEQARAGLRAAVAGRAAAKTGLADLKVQYQRFLGLKKKGAVAQAAFEKVETGYKATQSKFEAAAAQARLAEVVLKTTRKKLSDAVARAPFDGVVTQRFMDAGEMARVMPPSVIVVIMALDPVKAEGQVAERDLASIRKGAQVEVTVDSLSGRRFPGQVEAVVPFIDPATRTAKVRVRIPNPKHELKPGMAATLRISLTEREVLTIPREAIVSREANGQATLFVIDGEDRIHKRKVRVDSAEQGPAAVVLEGLRAGERVIVAGPADLSDRQHIRVATDPQPSAPGGKAAANSTDSKGDKTAVGRAEEGK